MDIEDFNPSLEVRPGNHNLTVKSAGTEQRGIEHIRAIGRGNQDHPLVRIKPIHLDQELVKGLLPLVMTAAKACSPEPPHGIDLINKDNTGGMFFALLKEVAH